MSIKKFTKLNPDKPNSQNKDKLVYKDFAIQIYDYDDWRFVKQKDGVICIPYLIETNQIIVRQEYIPSYKYVDGHDYHLHLVGGGIELGETPELALLRELQEEAGLVLRDNFNIEFDKPLFVAKHCSARYFPCILPLNENDYHEIVIKGDGTKFEQMAQTVKLDLKYLNSLNSSDVITELMLEKLKRYLNM
jgi:8-oxo-dGTP pyrophosphatase MutT (NUDIX family)